MYCKTFSSIPGFYALDDNGIVIPNCDKQKDLQKLLNVLNGANTPTQELTGIADTF